MMPRMHLPSHWTPGDRHGRRSRKRAGLSDHFVCLFNVSFFYFVDKRRDIDRYRTSLDAFRILAVEASLRLFHRLFFIITEADPRQNSSPGLSDPALLPVLFSTYQPLFVTSAMSRIRRDGCRPPEASGAPVLPVSCTYGFSSSPGQSLPDARQIPARPRMQT